MSELQKIEPTVEPPGGASIKKADGDTNDDKEDDLTKSRLNCMETELIRLRKENQTLNGKIRGYQTLGQLLHEAKEEGKKYRKICEELMAKAKIDSGIDFHAESFSGLRVQELKMNDYETLSSSEDTALLKLKETRSMKMAPASDQQVLEATDADVFLSPDEETKVRDPMMTVGSADYPQQLDDDLRSQHSSSEAFRKPNHANRTRSDLSENAEPDSDELRFKKLEKMSENDISCTTTSTGIHDDLESHAIQESSNFENSEIDFGHDMEKNRDFSKKVNQLQALFDPQSQNLSSELLQLTLKIRQLEKKLNMNQVHMQALTDENTKIKGTVAEKEAQLKNKQIEHAKLLMKLKQREHERDHLSPVNDQSEWLTVERRLKNDTQGEEIVAIQLDKKENEVLKKKISSLQQQNEELMKVNENWDAYWKTQKASHENQLRKMQQELEEARHSQRDISQHDEQRQREIDRMLLSTKKKLEEYETEKEEALQEAHAERGRRQEKEQMLDEEKRKNRELEEKIRDLERQLEGQHGQAVGAGYRYPPFSQTNWTPPPMMQGTIGSSPVMENFQMAANINPAYPQTPVYPQTPLTNQSAPSAQNISAEDLKTQIEILKQQVTIYKDDFDTERKDRERVMHEKEEMNKQFETLTNELISTQKQLAVVHKKLTSEKHEKTRKEVELQRLKQKSHNVVYPPQEPTVAAPPLMNYQPLYAGSSVYVDRPPNWNVTPQEVKWQCGACTFSNPQGRTYCEMCGRHRGYKRQESPSGGQNRVNEANQQYRNQTAYMHQRPLHRGAQQYPQLNIASDDLVTDSGEQCD